MLYFKYYKYYTFKIILYFLYNNNAINNNIISILFNKVKYQIIFKYLLLY